MTNFKNESINSYWGISNYYGDKLKNGKKADGMYAHAPYRTTGHMVGNT